MSTSHTRFTYHAAPTLSTDGSDVDALCDGYGRLEVVIAGGGGGGGDATAANQVLEIASLGDINTQTFALSTGQHDTSQISQVYGATKGSTAVGPVTSTSVDANHQGLDVVEQYMDAAVDNLTNGVYAVVNKPLATNTYAPTLYTYYAAAITKALISTGTHNAFSFVVFNNNIAVRYFQLHNKATAPVATDVPLLSFPVPALGSLVLGAEWFTSNGIYFSLGLGWFISTTIATATDAATASDHFYNVTYK